MNKQQRIRAFWKQHMPDILATEPNRWCEMHFWDTEPAIQMTPIERAMWHDLRMVGLVMYPQIPIGPYFSDFANPAARVVIECDGLRWHDAEKDAQRDGYMRAAGWHIYRFSGSRCMEMPQVYTDENGYEREHPAPLIADLREIGERHGINFKEPATKSADERGNGLNAW